MKAVVDVTAEHPTVLFDLSMNHPKLVKDQKKCSYKSSSQSGGGKLVTIVPLVLSL